MATMVRISSNNARGQELMNANAQVLGGIAVWNKYDGLRNEAISSGNGGADNMAAVFGVADGTQAQALSDRWGALLDALNNPGNPNYAAFALLRDFLNATTYQ